MKVNSEVLLRLISNLAMKTRLTREYSYMRSETSHWLDVRGQLLVRVV